MKKNYSMLMVRKAIEVLSIGIGMLLVCFPLFSQANFGRILGSVTDQTGGVMADVTVIVTDVQRGISRTLTTDQAGEYAAPSLLPGTYTVRVESTGFNTSEHTGILLEVGKDVRVNFSLRPGARSEKITVTGELPIVEITSATLGGTLSNQIINDLPLNGRNYQNLLPLRPGVVIYPGGGGGTQSTNGLRPDDNVYLIDGLTNNEPWTGASIVNGETLAGDASTILPLDAIQEFNTEENPRAEYGWKPGAVVNVGLKSGTNSLHGTAYGFGRDGSWDARNYFNPAPTPKYPLALEQFGATVGGPIKRDKIFWFLAYEGQLYTVGAGFNIETPVTCAGGAPGCGLTATEPGVSLVDACNALTTAGETISPLSAQIAGLNTATCTVAPANFTPGLSESLFPTNNGNASSQDPKFLPSSLISNNRNDNGVAKIDYRINDRHTLNGMYFIGQQGAAFNDQARQVAPMWMSLVHIRAQLGSGSWTWTPNSSWVNEFRAGYGRFYQTFFSADHNVPAIAYGINTGVTNPLYGGFPIVMFGGFNMQLGGGWPKIVGPDGVYQFVDHASYLRGKHALKFGTEIMENKHSGTITTSAKGFNAFFGGQDPANPDSTSLEDFLTGNVGFAEILVGNVFRETHTWGYAAFLQDDWHITPRVTLNLGVRYEINTVLKEAHNLLANFYPNSPTGLVQVGKQISSPYNGDHTNFAPRLGLAWDVRGNGKTVVRAGGGITYEQFAQQVFLGVGNLFGLGTVPTGANLSGADGTPIASPGNIAVTLADLPGSAITPGWQNNGPNTTLFPASTLAVMCGDGLANSSGGTDPGPCTTLAVAPNLRTPYVSTWTVGIEQAFTNDLSLDLAYVGNRGSRLLGELDANQRDIKTGVAPYAAKFPYLQSIDVLSNQDSSKYNGLQATLTQRVSHGLSFVAGYTYSQALDDASANWQGGVPLDSFHPQLQFAASDFDVRHRFTLAVTYALAGRKSQGQLLEGWQLNSIVTLQTGLPWAPQDFRTDFSGTGEVNNNPQSTGERWDFFGNPKDFTSGPNPIPCFGDVLCGNGTAVPLACITAASKVSPASVAQLDPSGVGGCFMQGGSVLIPPAAGTYGTAGRNIFRDSGLRDWDVSVTKDFKFRERLTAQFRAEFFNVLNHPNFANPYGGPNGYANNDPSAGMGMGCGCVTPDVAAENPVLGSGGNRAIQLGLKFIF
jgi:outer membrane receptor protein involved in Fe transport